MYLGYFGGRVAASSLVNSSMAVRPDSPTGQPTNAMVWVPGWVSYFTCRIISGHNGISYLCVKCPWLKRTSSQPRHYFQSEPFQSFSLIHRHLQVIFLCVASDKFHIHSPLFYMTLCVFYLPDEPPSSLGQTQDFYRNGLDSAGTDSIMMVGLTKPCSSLTNRIGSSKWFPDYSGIMVSSSRILNRNVFEVLND